MLTPLRFLERSASVWKDRPAVVSGKDSWTYAEHYDRVRRAAAVVREELGIGEGDRLAVLLPNVAPMLELTYAVPGVGGVLVPLNTRLADAEYDYILEHSGAKVLVADRELQKALDPASRSSATTRRASLVEEGDAPTEYEELLEAAEPIDLERPDDERALISINYTSGTTGKPKGVMTNHRGAYLHALGVIAEARLTPRSSYLWTLPMFHCNGWAYPWAVTAMGAKHVCLPKVEARPDLERAHQGGRHAPVRRADRAHDDHRRRRGRAARGAGRGVRGRRAADRRRCWRRARSSTSTSPTSTG